MKHLKKIILIVSAACTTLISGCTQYNFRENAMTAPQEYTEIYTEIAYLNENDNKGLIKDAVTSQNESVYENSTIIDAGEESSTTSIPSTTNTSNTNSTNSTNNINESELRISNDVPVTVEHTNVMLSYPAEGYYLITDSYKNTVLEVIEKAKAAFDTNINTLNGSYENDANIYAANMAFIDDFVNSNINNDIHIFMCMTTSVNTKSITNAVNKLCSSHPEILGYDHYSIGIAHNVSSKVYVCVMAD